jgi:hypothetical protein
METRYCGDLRIELQFRGAEGDRLRFSGRIIHQGSEWPFDHVLVDRTTESELPAAFDIAAAGAVHFGSKYNRGYDPAEEGEIPAWAPPVDVAQAFNDRAAIDDQGFCIRREPDGPDTYSG